MPMYDFCCPACGVVTEDQMAPAGQWPTCACGATVAPLWRTRAVAVKSDEWAGGKTFENGFPTPQTFYSPSEYHRALKENGFIVRGDGEEGGWAAMSRDGLRKATELVERMYPDAGRA